MRRSNYLVVLLLICFCFLQGHFGVCDRNQDEIIPAPPEDSTTQKSGFFSGVKNFFRGSPKTITTTTTTTPRSVAQGPFNAQRPPPLTISQALLVPLGPRPDTPISSPFGGQPNQPPQWPQVSPSAVSSSTTLRPQSAVHSEGLSSSTLFQQGNVGKTNQQRSGTQNFPSGFTPYRPEKTQPAGFDLSYGGSGTSGGKPSGNANRPGFNLMPLTTSTMTTTTTTTTTMRPPQSPQSQPPHLKEDFPPLPPPRKPSVGERHDTPPSAPKSPTLLPSSPSSRPSSPSPPPSPWNSISPAASVTPPPPSPSIPQRSNLPSTPDRSTGHGVSFIPSTGVRTPSNTNQQLATDDEIQQLTENLYTKEVNNQLDHIQVNIQGKTRSIDEGDEAPNPLLVVDNRALHPVTIAKLMPLFNNYEVDTLVNEYVSANERKEENDFVDAIMATNVMRQAMLFLQNKGIVTADPQTHRDLVKELWFTQYSRGSGKVGSSGFEHVFVNEVKNGTIIGLHNWVYFYEEEHAGRLDYKGYMKSQDIGTKGKIVKARFTHNGLSKPVNTLFIGTSPELELALYTVCFKLRPDRTCHVSLNNSKFGIVTYTWRYRGKNLIGSAYPEI